MRRNHSLPVWNYSTSSGSTACLSQKIPMAGKLNSSLQLSDCMKAMMKTKTFQNFLKRIGDGLCALRKQRGYENITDFTREYKLPMIQYWRIEKGKANVTLKSLAKLLAIHNIQPEDFFCWIKDSF